MEQRFLIPDRLPSLNDYINECRRSPYAGAELKKTADTMVAIYARGLEPIQTDCEIYIIFTEPNRKRDVDNVYSAMKYILDGLKNARIIKDDSPKWVRDIHPSIRYGDKASVEVIIT